MVKFDLTPFYLNHLSHIEPRAAPTPRVAPVKSVGVSRTDGNDDLVSPTAVVAPTTVANHGTANVALRLQLFLYRRTRRGNQCAGVVYNR